MSFKFEYDIKADRMKVELSMLNKKGGYWVTRRQWLNMIARLQNLELLPVFKMPADLQDDSGKSGQDGLSSNEVALTSSSVEENVQSDLNQAMDEIELLRAESVGLKSINIVKLDEKTIRVVLVADSEKRRQLNATFTLDVLQAGNLSKQMYAYSIHIGWEIEYALKRITNEMRSKNTAQDTLKKDQNNQNRYH